MPVAVKASSKQISPDEIRPTRCVVFGGAETNKNKLKFKIGVNLSMIVVIFRPVKNARNTKRVYLSESEF